MLWVIKLVVDGGLSLTVIDVPPETVHNRNQVFPIHMRIIGFIGLFHAAMALFAGFDRLCKIQGDWEGVATGTFGIVMFSMFGFMLWRGRQLELDPDSNDRPAKEWQDQSVSWFFRNNILRTFEGLALAAGSLLCFILLLVTATVPDIIGITPERAGNAMVLFGVWPVLVFTVYVRLIQRRAGPLFLLLSMLAAFLGVLFVVYG